MTQPGVRGRCWCGESSLSPFSPEYLKCDSCETLVLANEQEPSQFHVTDDAKDFYGEQYYNLFVQDRYGYPSLAERARLDLPERCLHWLRAVLRYKLPPARSLELGSAHGGLVALMRWAGYDATGLELSPSIVRFAQETFRVPMLAGPVEQQGIANGSLDMILLMDVIEHFEDPTSTMAYCLKLLRDDGVLLLQTPRYPEHATFEDLRSRQDPFLEQLKPEEHIFLFSEHSISVFFHRLGATHVAFEPAIFSRYDMFLAVSKSPFRTNAAAAIEEKLLLTPESRLILALLDQANKG